MTVAGTVTQSDSQPAYEVLRRVWGYDEFRPLQEEAVSDVIASRDSLVVLPTGGGKSLCYQVPALVRDGMAVVVSPLISLMKDQVDALTANGVAAALVNSTQSDEQKRTTAARIRSGEIRLLYMAPERLLSERTLSFLESVPISFFAIDEAHCVSNWGHDFRPEYRGLRILKQRFPDASVHAFTATASERVRDDIAEQLQLQSPKVLVGSFDRPNLTYRMLPSDGKLRQIRNVIDQHRGESGVVYCITRKEVEQTAAALESAGVSSLPYHAGLDDATRQANQEAFIQEKVDVIVATVAFGMGIDKSNVRFVIHAGMPKSIEHYQQESGRAGRDGLAAECVLIYSGGDTMTWKRIMENGDRSNFEDAMKSVYSMADLCSGVRCRHAAIVSYFGQEFDVDNCNACDVCLGELDTVEDPVTLSQKILSGVIRLKGRFGVAYTVKMLTGSRDQKLMDAGHDQLSTYGLLSNEAASTVKMWVEQLISQDYLARVGEYGTLALTPTGQQLLKRIGSVTLTRPNLKSSSRSSSRGAKPETSWEGVDRGLFEHLRSLRSELATQRSVPAYVIFGDAVLRQLARQRPSVLNKMSNIRGIGERKLEEFGTLFLESMDEYCQGGDLDRDVSVTDTSVAPPPPPKRPASAKGTLAQNEANDLFRQGKSIAEVAQAMGRAESTVNGYLSSFIAEDGIVDASPWVEAKKIPWIEEAMAASDDGRFKPIHDALAANDAIEDKISYEEIRVVASCFRNKPATT
ncbi:ATP-dependent DNA helicase RecQ [Neorhodopirellula lusitana]|uniref:DNA helicase RecQ n=1 Tax=Neorhodopirellula lusitana TaxID=445327 RepID=A0ABY1Q3K3_9BACT|nr:DNA helicase RecQ [Neorhodopirellula lusitana]SMP56382.1 ATP-dependent DNA helicase RecQ [Neorhodopirellula lusitana]